MSNTETDSAPTYSGDLFQVSIPKLLFRFFASNSNGRLRLSRDTITKDIFLVNGKPVAVISNVPGEQLGVYLVEKGALTSEQHTSLNTEGGQDDHLGDLIIRQGLLSSHELFEHLRGVLLKKILEVFRWRQGQYAFYQGQHYRGAFPFSDLDPWALLSNGVRQGYDGGELNKLLEPFRHHDITIKNNRHITPNQLSLLPSELKVFKSINDVHSLNGLLDLLGGSDERDKTVLSMIYMGIEMDLLETASAPKDVAMPTKKVSDTLGPSPRERELQQKLSLLREQNFFERLELDRQSTSKDAVKAFMRFARIYHPDQVPATESDHAKQLSADIFALLNEAQQTLSNEKKRTGYLEAIESGKTNDSVDVNSILQSEMLFSKAESMTKAFKFQAALELLDQAISLNAEEGEFLVYRGYAGFFANPQSGSNHKDACLQMINQGMKMRHDSLANGHYFAGLIHKATKDEDFAQAAFQRALSLDANHIEAARELRLLEMRKDKKGSRKK